MLKVNNLTITTLKGRVLMDGFSFVLNAGDKAALIGEEGNGKSTLLKIIAGIDVSDYVNHSGQIITDETLAYLPQKIEDSHLDDEVIDFICHGRDHDYTRIYDIIKILSIDPDLLHDRKVRTLSGGEKVKVSIGRMLYRDPDILLLDEPTNDLDLKTLLWLEDFISSSPKSVLFISHDETLLRQCATKIIHLEQLKKKQEPHVTFSSESYDDYYQRRIHNIDRTNQIARKEKAQFNKKLETFRKVYQKVEHQQSSISRQDPHGAALLKKKMRNLKAVEKRMDSEKENLTKKYEPEEAINIFFEDIKLNPDKVILDCHLDELKAGNKVLSRNINLYVRGDDKVAIIGNNGTGKTTLLKVLRDLLQDRDDILCGYMPQNYEEVLDYSISPVSYLYGICEDRSKCQNLLGSMKFTSEEMTHDIASLSEGQKCKILLAGLILKKANVLLLDEPTRNLSPLSNPEVRNMLTDYGGCIIAVTHDRMFINEVAGRVLEMTADGLREIY